MTKKHLKTFSPITLLFWLPFCFLPLALTGCGLLLGNVRPVEEKSENYKVMDLAKEIPEWRRIDDTGTNKTESSDLTYQARQTASIISLNSACRTVPNGPGEDLHTFNRELLLGISEIAQRTEQNLTVSGAPALETTIQGKLNGQPMKLRTVVVNKSGCVYDLMYIARPEHFEDHAQDFTRFISSLRIK